MTKTDDLALPRLSAHLGYLFSEMPLDRRFAAARAAGFEAVEHPAPYELPAARLRRLLEAEGFELIQMTSGTGAPGEKGIASLPGREAAFREDWLRGLDYAEEAGSGFLAIMAGIGGDADVYRANVTTALKLAEGRAPRVLVEPISQSIVPGYHLSRLDQALALAEEFEGRISILLDCYHETADGGELMAALDRAAPWLGHVHAADYPGRHEPGTGRIAFRSAMERLAAQGYAGAIGFEYVPSGPQRFDWIEGWKRDRASLFQPQHQGTMS